MTSDRVTRRGLLAGALGMGALSALPGVAHADPLASDTGVQLWAVKAELDQDFDGTLRRLAQIGYRRVEAAGYHGRSAADFRASVTGAGLVCGGSLVSMTDLLKDPVGQVGQVRDIGAGWLVCSSPKASGAVTPAYPGENWIDQMRRAMTLDDWRRNAEWLNQMGERARAAGLKLAYHSNVFEFSRYDHVVGFEELQRLTDPRLVWTELDVGWAVAAGRDPVTLMRRYPNRIRLLHIKDMKARPAPGKPSYVTVAVGSGVIDWRPVFAEGRRIGVEHCYVEQEPPYVEPILADLAKSYSYMQGI
jgi:sugar phosphate isomerase/epimerase